MLRCPKNIHEYFHKREVFEPDGIIIGADLDARAREESEEKYPFGSEYSAVVAGCYLIFDNIDASIDESINPIYVGRSRDLKKRLWTHWCEDRNNVLDAYHQACEKGLFIKEVLNEYSYDVLELKSGAPTCFAIWFFDDERERMLFEHELIYKCKPLMNKA